MLDGNYHQPKLTYYVNEKKSAIAPKVTDTGANTIEVKVTTLMGNYMHTLKDNKVAQRFVIKRKQPYVSAGLIGPVKLY